MNYIETVEEYNTLHELQSDIHFILKKFREVGNLDVELKIDLLELTITVISPEENDDA